MDQYQQNLIDYAAYKVQKYLDLLIQANNNRNIDSVHRHYLEIEKYMETLQSALEDRNDT